MDRRVWAALGVMAISSALGVATVLLAGRPQLPPTQLLATGRPTATVHSQQPSRPAAERRLRDPAVRAEP